MTASLDAPGRPPATLAAGAGVPAALLLASAWLLRPGVFGERLAIAGLGVVVVAGAVALLRREQVAVRPQPTVVALVALVTAAYLWLLGHGIWVVDPGGTRSLFQDFALTVGTLVVAALLLADPATCRAAGRGLVLVLAVLSLSWVGTALLWAVAGIGAGRIGAIPVGGIGPQPVYLPFTISYSTWPVFGVDVPRLTGLGRESGWMAMYCAAGWFLAPAVGYRSRVLRGLLLAGLVGTLSTAGFGVLLVVLVWHAFLRPRGPIALRGFLRQVVGLAALGGAVWVAVAAPVVGLGAKQSGGNGTSLTEREQATEQGLHALRTAPFGGAASSNLSGVNLVADIAANGLPFALLVVAALLLPALAPRHGGGNARAVALVVLLTLLFSQPAAASTWAFVVVALALAADGLTDAERSSPGSARPVLVALHRRCAGAS